MMMMMRSEIQMIDGTFDLECNVRRLKSPPSRHYRIVRFCSTLSSLRFRARVCTVQISV